MSLRSLVVGCLALLLCACQAGTPDTADTSRSDAARSDATGAMADAVSATSPLTNAEDDVKASMDKFLAARSFHATMDLQGPQSMTNEMDFVAPDRYRMSLPVGTQVIIGDTMYMQTAGKSMKVPLPEGTLGQWRDPLKIQESKAGLSVEAQGREASMGSPRAST